MGKDHHQQRRPTVTPLATMRPSPESRRGSAQAWRMRMKPQDPDMAQNFSDLFAAIHPQPEKPPLVSHGEV
jgi:hypothetical protein